MFKNLTLPQKNMYESEIFYSGTSISNIGGCIFLNDKEVDINILKKAINKVIEYSDGLRFTINSDIDKPLQKENDYEYEYIEKYALEADYKTVLEKWMQECFDITKKMYEFKIIVLEDKIGVFAKLHHIVCDAWGVTLIASKIIEYYYKLLDGGEVENDMTSFTSLIPRGEEYLKSARYNKDKAFWESKYEEKPTFVSMSPNKKSNMDITAKRSSFSVPVEETEAINRFCEENQISPAVLLEAVTILYAARINNADDVTLCEVVINRNGADEKNCIGMFNNILPLTVNIDYNESFSNLCQKIMTEHYQVFRHQKYPLGDIMKYIRDKHDGDSNIYDIMVSYQNSRLSQDGETEWIFNGTSDLGFMLNISERDNDGKLSFDFDYRVNCFTKEDIESIYYRFINIVNQAVINPSITCKEVDIVTEFEKKQILEDFNDTSKDYPKDRCLYKYLEENAIKNPDKKALYFEGQEMTYREFNEKVNSLAHFINQNTDKRNSTIGITMERSFEMMIAIYAVLKAGHAYMPIDPHIPTQRIEFMLEDCDAPLVITQTKWLNVFEKNDRILDINKFDFEKYDKSNLDIAVAPTDTAYVIYTSGSTGRPKGAMVPHHSAINRIKWMHEKYPLLEGDVILQKTPYTFDVSVWELFWWSMYNGSLKILIPEGHKDPSEIINAVEEGKVTHMHFVPSMLNAFLEYIEVNKKDIERLKTVRYIFASGEALQVAHVKKLYELLGVNGTTLHNLYGPTECTVDVSYYDCDKNNIPNSIPIGKPVDNTQLLILDKNFKLLPIGVVGELYISGALVGKGYLNRPDLTAEKFVPNIYYNYATMYKTGDLAMWLPDGNIEYLGRSDFQVKIRGLRVELGDIENAILHFEGITQVIVVVFEANGEKNLCAYYVSAKEIDEPDLKDAISKELPDYMVPQYFVRLDKIPTNANGKADRKALPIPEIKEKELIYVAPKSDLEGKLQNIICETLNLEKVSCDANLFELGLTSLGVISIITKLSILGYELKVRDFYECHTIIEIADFIGNSNVNIDDYKEDMEKYQDISDISFYQLPDKESDYILLTGASGYLGIHILKELITKTNKKIYCLIRSEEKFKSFISGYTDLDINDSRIIPVIGDITKAKLGFTDELYSEIVDNVSDIIHSAAYVKFFCGYDKAEELNYIGACNVIEASRLAKAKLHHISTISVSGDILARQTREFPEFSEKDLYIGQVYKDNVYSHSKYLAEREIVKAIREDKINASIYRVANLTWRATDGVFQPNYDENDIFIITSVMLKYQMAPLEIMNENVSLTPVDDCARAIVSLLTNKNENAVYNLFSRESMSIGEYIKTIGDVNFVPMKKFYNELIKDSDDVASQFVSMYVKGIIEMPEKSVVTIHNDYTLKELDKIDFKWSKLGDRYLQMFKKIGGRN